ncbi:MAG: 4-hydroxy-tetrahydrodipicolinate reductase, partial [Candidatus Ornithospirochaeta sp.]
AIVGFGKMGKAILSVLEGKGHGALCIIDPFSQDNRVTGRTVGESTLRGADVVIDFSSPESACDNIRTYIDLGIPAVIGTTGWLEKLDEITAYAQGKDARVMYSGNYSIGVALFIRLVKKAGELYGKVNDYDVAINEIHHNEKKDSPSGTALMIGSAILDTVPSKKRILIGNSEGKIGSEELQITSQRVGRVPGVHSVTFDSDADTITLTHSARSRSGFASGAVLAAEWILETEKRGMLTLDDYLNETFGE